ncbi:class I SAM-dependent methyltransferase [Neisseria sp.]|uniref:class I SAM-dependent methyltransferase n=1 Tax=Neisseria sp. TaxID=192066 RepID=UPI0026DC0996|nr:methyltransferase domain-containing protein [Neisseria sp.]MDO4227310.1 methyltransferase domain-containing protein [Neisseria sp.]
MELSSEQIAAQLRCPHDEAGVSFGQVMNLRNLPQIAGAFAAVGIEGQDRILETGCGDGGLLGYVLSLAENVHYTGLEISPLMQQQAQAFNAPFIAANKAEYRLYDGRLLPFENGAFHKAVSVNTVYFWEDALEMLAETCRVLQTGGRFCLSFCEKDFMKRLPFAEHGFTLYDAADIRRLAEKIPFRCLAETRSRDWAVSKSGDLVRRECVHLVCEKYEKAV